MGSRPTITDLATKAGVSIATVDRVLNGRLKVRDETSRRVYEAAKEIGFHATSLIRQRIQADMPEIRLGFSLEPNSHPFYQTFAIELAKAVESTPGVRIRTYIEFAKRVTPTENVEMLEFLGKRCQAVAMTSFDHHSVTKAVDNLRLQGKPVFSLLSDFAQGVREGYIGLNNMKVGRTAAWLISQMAKKPGKVALFVGSHRWHGHELRETGFRSYFREHAPDFELLDTVVNLDTPQVTHETTLNMLGRYPDLVGFYVAGGGMEGAISALREEAKTRKLSVVVNEATPDSVAALQDHIVSAAIATPLPLLCRSLVDAMVNAVLNGFAETPGQLFLPFNLLVPESL